MSSDSSVTPPKLRLPQRQPRLQSVTLSSLATIEERKPTGFSPSAPMPLSAYHSSSTHTPPGLPVPTGSLSGRPLEVGIGWHAGIHRQHAPNEDSVMALQNICTHQGQLVPFSLLVVADGMGGHACGLEASQIAVQMMMHTVLQNIVVSSEASDEFFSDMLVGGVDWANRAIYQRGQRLGKTMGTTVTAALVVGMKAYIVNVGDSRTYLYREGMGLRQITHDHSVVATLVAFGEISSDEVYTHPERNQVYRSVGSDEYVDVDCFNVDLRRGDVLLLCSDGLWEMMRDPIITRILRHYQDLARASDALIEAALQGGGVDNVSVIVARVP